MHLRQPRTSIPYPLPLSTPATQAKNKKAQDGWSKEEEKLLVQLLAEKHDQLESRESQGANQHGVVFCSQILFLSATVAFRTIFLSVADFESDLSRTNLKLPSNPLRSVSLTRKK